MIMVCYLEKINVDRIFTTLFLRRVEMMFQGKCPRCGRLYFGWALAQADYQKCVICSIKLMISQEDKTNGSGYNQSPQLPEKAVSGTKE
jgi:hypothetical protein